MSGDGYVVDIKPSARRANATAGRIVYEEGSRREFASREMADRWARDLSRGDGDVWVRDANPDDRTGADGYLISDNRARAGGARHGPLREYE